MGEHLSQLEVHSQWGKLCKEIEYVILEKNEEEDGKREVYTGIGDEPQ